MKYLVICSTRVNRAFSGIHCTQLIYVKHLDMMAHVHWLTIMKNQSVLGDECPKPF